MRFDKEANLWDEKPRRVALAKKVVEKIETYCNNKTILDFGCGTGLVSLNLKNAKRILGVDLSSEMIKIFNQKVEMLQLPAKGVVSDIKHIDNKFDIIVANMVFHHIEKIDEMLQILSTKLTKNGKLFISDLFLEDGSFHDKGNEDVFHFGFEKNSFSHTNFELKSYSHIFTIEKERKNQIKKYKVYLWELENRV